jgi:8-oxo-dGTP diphosphatase
MDATSVIRQLLTSSGRPPLSSAMSVLNMSETGPMPSGRTGQHQVVAAMLLRADTVLLCHRSRDRAWYPDVWDLPGGHIEANEAPGDALVREIQEELGVTLSGPLGGHSFSRATEEFEMRVWTSHGWSGTPANCAPHEHDEIGWFTEREVHSLRLADDAYRSWIAEGLSSER